MTVDTIQVKVTLRNDEEKSHEDSLKVSRLSQPERLKRALKILGIIWGIAIACVLIPILHFILVPAGLLAGPIVAYVIYTTDSLIQKTSVKCPECQADIAISQTKEKWPHGDLCTQCRKEIVITRDLE